MSLFAGTQMVNHSQFQTVKHVMGMQTAHFIDGAMVTPLMMKVNMNALIQRVSYFSIRSTSSLSIKIRLNIRDQNLQFCWGKKFMSSRSPNKRSENFDYL